jgi:hypothetical protein
VGTHLTLVEQLLEAGAQEAPLVEVLLAAVAAVDDDAANATSLEECLVDGEICEVGHHFVALGLAQRLLLDGFRAVERQRGVVRISGERVRWQRIT